MTARGRELRFLKVEGGGNDFVLVDARKRTQSPPGGAAIRRLLDRHRGIGGDGLLWLFPGRGEARARVRYWNADGGAAAFCGNGARCVALCLLGESRGSGEVSFDFGPRRLRARRGGGDSVAILVPRPADLPLPDPLPSLLRGPAGLEESGAPAADPWMDPAWIDSGVPHWILPVASVEQLDFARIAPGIRACPALGAGGTNVDVVEIRGRVLHVRTWERGVEGETLSCGSGLVAAGWWALTAGNLRLPLGLRSRGKDRFRLLADPEERGLWLEGPAHVVFAGRMAPG